MYSNKIDLVLGSMLFGSLTCRNEAESLICKFLDNGFFSFDSAPIYPSPCSMISFGTTEEIIGDVLLRIGKERKQSILISTKFPSSSSKLDYTRKLKGAISFSELRNSIQSSLARLKVDTIDIFYIHWPERLTTNFGRFIHRFEFCQRDIDELDESYANLFQIATAGYCRSVGISNETPFGAARFSAMREKSNYTGPVYIQNPYNILTPYFDMGLKEIAQAFGIGLCAHSPLAFGVLSTSRSSDELSSSRISLYSKYFSRYAPRNTTLLERIKMLAEELGLSLEELSIRYVLSNQVTKKLIVGPRTVRQLDICMKYYLLGGLDTEILTIIDNIYSEVASFAF